MACARMETGAETEVMPSILPGHLHAEVQMCLTLREKNGRCRFFMQPVLRHTEICLAED